MNGHTMSRHSWDIPSVARKRIDRATVAALIRDNFPALSGLPVQAVEENGWDNHTFRLGNEYKVRLPASSIYLSQLDKEVTWLPRLAPYLPFSVPVPVGKGRPGHGYPFAWSVWKWIEGDPATVSRIGNLNDFAEDIANFLIALERCSTDGGPAAGPDNFHRGGDLRVYGEQTRSCLQQLSSMVDVKSLSQIWAEAISTSWAGPPVWVHGDVAAGNLLVRDGRLQAVIDFGSSACGDPACDLVINWTLFDMAARQSFSRHYKADAATWSRARGWCLWKALLVLSENIQCKEIRNREVSILEALIRDFELT